MSIAGIRASGAGLLELPQGSDEFLDQPEVRAQPPEQQKQQQGYQGDNYQVLQVPFSAKISRLMVTDVRDQLRARRVLGLAGAPAAFFSRIRQIIFAAARKGVDVPAPRGRCVGAPIDTARGQRAAMNCFGENSGNLLRKGAMLGRGATTERLFQFIGDISTDEHAFTIDHLFSELLLKSSPTANEGRFRFPAEQRRQN